MIGTSVTLHHRVQKTEGGVPVFDAFHNPVYEDETAVVPNVLIGQPTTDEVTSSIDLYGKKIEYMLGVPKGDTHNWEDATVTFFGKTYQTFGNTIEGIEANIPTPWHKKVRVCRYE